MQDGWPRPTALRATGTARRDTMCGVSPVGRGGHALAEGRGVERRQGLAQLRGVHDLALPAAAAAAVGLLLRKRVEQREQARIHRVALRARRSHSCVSLRHAWPGMTACCHKRDTCLLDRAQTGHSRCCGCGEREHAGAASAAQHKLAECKDATRASRCPAWGHRSSARARQPQARSGAGLGRAGRAAHRQRVARQAQQALPERGAVPQALHDHVEEAVVLAGLVLQARLGRRRGAGRQRPRRRARGAQRVALGRPRLQLGQARLRQRAAAPR